MSIGLHVDGLPSKAPRDHWASLLPGLTPCNPDRIYEFHNLTLEQSNNWIIRP